MRRLLLVIGLMGAALVAVGRGQEKPAEGKSSAAAVQIYQDAASLQNNGSFELAVEEWQKLLKNHPQDPLAAKGQHYLGVCLMQLNQPDKAAEAFQAVIKNHPKFELLEDAYLNLGSSQFAAASAGKPELYPAAAQTLAKLITDFPKSKQLEDALYLQGEVNYAQEKRPEAVAAYDRLLKEFPKSRRRADTLYALGVAQEEQDKFAEAGATYDAFLKEFAANPLATEVKMRKAETVLQTGDPAAAAKLFGEVVGVKDFALAAHALSQQAYCQVKLEKFAEAGALYAKVATDFPQSPNVAEATMAAGRCYYKANQLDEAAVWLAKAVQRKDANSPEAAHWQCLILMGQQKPAEAADLAAKQIAAGGDSPYLVNLKLDQADALYAIPERRAESLALYTQLAKDHPQFAPTALYYAAFTAVELKKFDEALQHTAAFLTAHADHKLAPDVKYLAAESHRLLEKLPDAEKGYADLLAAHPGHAEAELWKLRHALVLSAQNKHAETIAALTPVVAALKAPDALAEAQFRLGGSYFATEKFAEAEQALAASVAASAKWAGADAALLLLARAQAAAGKLDEARASARKVIADYPESTALAEAHYRLGQWLAGADSKAAVAEYQQVVTKWPASPFAPYALYGSGAAQLAAKEHAAGIESFTALLTTFPDHKLKADSLFSRAICRREAGDGKGALEDIEAYLATNPAPAEKSAALYQKGLAQVALKDNAAAAKTLEDLLQADPKYAAADAVLYELAWALKSQGQHPEGAAVFARLTAEHAASPLAPEAWLYVAEDQYDKKDYAAAAKGYALAKQAAAGELVERASYKLGWAHYQLKQYDEALQQFSEQLSAYGQGPLASDATFMKAECLFRLQNYEEAWPAFQAAAKTKAHTPAIEVLTLLHGGQSAAQLKQWPEAIATLTDIPAKHPESPFVAEALYELGWAKQNSGQPDEALKDYEAAATTSRDQVGARARFMLGELYFEQKKFVDASREFQRAMFQYGGEQASAETKNWQAKSGYEAGRCAEVQIMNAKDAAAKQKLIADAKRFYTFVVEKHPQHELVAEAKKRLDVIGKL